jgi:small conductance mechanosensitive channel
MSAPVAGDRRDERAPGGEGPRTDYEARGRRVQVLRERTLGAFDTRSERWQEAGLTEQLNRKEARKALRETALFFFLLVAVLLLFGFRTELDPDLRKPIRYATAILLVFIGWGLARSAAKGLAPAMFRRMDPATAGSVGFLIRLFTIVAVVFASLAIAGVDPEALAVGGAFASVIVGLAAQQTLGNVIAGAMLLSARPFRVADRIKLQGGMLAGNIEGTVASLGLFYMTMVSGGNRILVPNNVLMNIAVIPLGEPDAIELTARFDEKAITPAKLQRSLDEAITVPLRRAPRIELEEVDANDVLTLRITVVPESGVRAAELASEVLEAIRGVGGEGSDTGTRQHDVVDSSGEGTPAG